MEHIHGISNPSETAATLYGSVEVQDASWGRGDNYIKGCPQLIREDARH
jgi:hypothetical protein